MATVVRQKDLMNIQEREAEIRSIYNSNNVQSHHYIQTKLRNMINVTDSAKDSGVYAYGSARVSATKISKSNTSLCVNKQTFRDQSRLVRDQIMQNDFPSNINTNRQTTCSGYRSVQSSRVPNDVASKQNYQSNYTSGLTSRRTFMIKG